MPTVSNIVEDGAGNPAKGVSVTITLYAGQDTPGFADGATVGAAHRSVTGVDGSWSADLAPNSDYLPSGTHYRVTEAFPDGRRVQYALIVPDEAGPFKVRDVLAAAPASPDPLVPVGSGGGAVSSVDGRTGAVSLSDRYAALAHSHTQAQVTGLSTALAGKVDTADPRLSDARTPVAHNHTEADVTGLAADLAKRSTVKVWNGTAYVDASGATVYVGGPTDPTTVNGDVWISGA